MGAGGSTSCAVPRRSRNARATFFQVRPFFCSSSTGRRDLAGVTVARTTDRAPLTPAAVRPGWASGGSTRSLTVCFLCAAALRSACRAVAATGVGEPLPGALVVVTTRQAAIVPTAASAVRRAACGRRHLCPCLTGPPDVSGGRAFEAIETPPGVSDSWSQTPRLLSSFPIKRTFHTSHLAAADRHGPAPPGAVGWRRPSADLRRGGTGVAAAVARAGRPADPSAGRPGLRP